MSNTNLPSIANLKRAIEVAEQIEKLQAQLTSLVGSSASVAAPAKSISLSPVKKSGKRTMSPEARERIAAAQRARWAKSKGASAMVNKSAANVTPAPKKKRKMSAEGRARIVAALKARWAKKKGGATSSAPATTAKPAAAPKAAKKRKRIVSPEARAKMAAAAKRRWAK